VHLDTVLLSGSCLPLMLHDDTKRCPDWWDGWITRPSLKYAPSLLLSWLQVGRMVGTATKPASSGTPGAAPPVDAESTAAADTGTCGVEGEGEWKGLAPLGLTLDDPCGPNEAHRRTRGIFLAEGAPSHRVRAGVTSRACKGARTYLCVPCDKGGWKAGIITME
jgi:hypothetical protein